LLKEKLLPVFIPDRACQTLLSPPFFSHHCTVQPSTPFTLFPQCVTVQVRIAHTIIEPKDHSNLVRKSLLNIAHIYLYIPVCLPVVLHKAYKLQFLLELYPIFITTDVGQNSSKDSSRTSIKRIFSSFYRFGDQLLDFHLTRRVFLNKAKTGLRS
jgi:hypothetical protein